MPDKPTKLIYRGKSGPRKGDSFPGVPARDLNEADIAKLDAATLRNITGDVATVGPLYVAPEDEKPEPEQAEAKARKG
jgi:hypothetical protein